MDEHRIGLKPILRRVWARRGKRPIAVVRPRYQWLWLYSFVRPRTGESWWLLLPRVSVAAMTAALAAFAQAVGAGRTKRIVLVLDRAGWHRSARVTIPDGVTLEALPAYSPELQPVERVWSLIDSAVANRLWETIEALEEAVIRRCGIVREQLSELVRRMTCYRWWPSFA